MGTYSYSMAAGCPNPSAYNWYTSSNGYTWSWAGNGGGISQFFYPNFPSPFYVKCVLSYPGLPDKNYFRTTNIIYNPPYKIAKQDQINGLTPMLSPNPVNEYVIIDIALNKDQIKSVKCFNEFGLEINLKYEYQESQEMNSTKMKAQLSNLKSGIYQLVINDGTKIVASKFIKL